MKLKKILNAGLAVLTAAAISAGSCTPALASSEASSETVPEMNARGEAQTQSEAGETETIIPEETETCLKFKVSSLSPVLVTWTRAAEEAEEVSTDNTVSVNEVPNEVPATMESRAPKTGENMTFIMATVFCLMAGAGLTGYALFIRRKRNR